MIHVIIFGAPGAGKGTQSRFIEQRYHLEHISTGDLLRQEIARESPLGKRVQSIISQGHLVDDETIIDLIGNELHHLPEGVDGVIFDGFPRTIPQAEALQAAGIPIDFVLEIQVPDAEIVERMSGRRVDPVSGRTYHIKYNPPKVEGKDDVTGDPLIQRDDDREEVVRKRLDVYHSQTEALVGFYSDLAKSGDKTAPQYRAISGLGAIDAITARVFEALK